jgi:site-specific recombinase XerD
MPFLTSPIRKDIFLKAVLRVHPIAPEASRKSYRQPNGKPGVIKPGSIHCLRHSFATHLIDKGTDVTMIQKLLGHTDIRTTLRYLHTTNRDLLKIVSPLDDLHLR